MDRSAGATTRPDAPGTMLFRTSNHKSRNIVASAHVCRASNAHTGSVKTRPRNCRGNGGCCRKSGAQKVGKVGKQAAWTPRHALSHPCQPHAAPLVTEGRRQWGEWGEAVAGRDHDAR